MRGINDLLSTQSSLSQQGQPVPGSVEGVVIKGSYNPAECTVQVWRGDTGAQINGSPDQPIALTARLESSHVGDVYGPIGGERVLLTRTQSGWSAKLEHGADDSPNVPAGERWITHRTSSGTTNAAIKLTNDGTTAGDGKGGVTITLSELISLATAGGLKVVCDDVAGKVFLGATGLATPGDGVVRQSDLQAAINSLITNTNTALTTLAGRCASGTGVAASSVAAVTAPGSTHVLAQS